MDRKKHLSYAKTHRKRSGLSQDELAYLLGDKTTSFILKTEHSKEMPSLSRALSYQILFGIPAEEIFTGLLQQQQNLIFNKIVELSGNLERRPKTQIVTRKLEFLDATARRIAGNSKQI